MCKFKIGDKVTLKRPPTNADFSKVCIPTADLDPLIKYLSKNNVVINDVDSINPATEQWIYLYTTKEQRFLLNYGYPCEWFKLAEEPKQVGGDFKVGDIVVAVRDVSRVKRGESIKVEKLPTEPIFSQLFVANGSCYFKSDFVKQPTLQEKLIEFKPGDLVKCIKYPTSEDWKYIGEPLSWRNYLKVGLTYIVKETFNSSISLTTCDDWGFPLNCFELERSDEKVQITPPTSSNQMPNIEYFKKKYRKGVIFRTRSGIQAESEGGVRLSLTGAEMVVTVKIKDRLADSIFIYRLDNGRTWEAEVITSPVELHSVPSGQVLQSGSSELKLVETITPSLKSKYEPVKLPLPITIRKRNNKPKILLIKP